MEEFEKWASRQGYILDKNEDGTYQYIGMRNLWACWQAAQHSVQPTLLTLCPECGVEQIVTHLPTCAHYVAQSG